MKGTPAKVNWGLTKRPHAKDLIPGQVIKTCARCGEPTFWVAPGQRDLGYCQHHALTELVDDMTAIGVVMEIFAGIAIDFDLDSRPLLGVEPVVVTGRWFAHWAPYRHQVQTFSRDAGPCEGCRRPVRRYGPDAYAFCEECRP
jgi:hypothetical protein